MAVTPPSREKISAFMFPAKTAPSRHRASRISSACPGPRAYRANSVTMLASPSLIPGMGMARDKGKKFSR